MAGRKKALTASATIDATAHLWGPAASTSVDRSHGNNIGIIRLTLASLVILWHTTSISIGGIETGPTAVYAFFLISGFLITQSWERRRSIREYLSKRVLRIYPAFLVAWVISWWVGQVMQGIDPNYYAPGWTAFILGVPPETTRGWGTNTSMWTIAYEFRCYLLIVPLSLLPRQRVAQLTAVTLGLYFVVSFLTSFHLIAKPSVSAITNLIIGDPHKLIMLVAYFMLGATAYHYRDRLDAFITGRVALGCAAALAVISVVDQIRWVSLAPVVAFCGGGALYWLAFKANLGPLQRINARTDISYGTYLYGAPVQLVLMTLYPDLRPAVLLALNLPIAMGLGWISWHVIERPALQLIAHPARRAIAERR